MWCILYVVQPDPYCNISQLNQRDKKTTHRQLTNDDRIIIPKFNREILLWLSTQTVGKREESAV